MKQPTLKICIACKGEFLGGANAMCCSPECHLARRRGVQLGVDAAPPKTATCEICGATFPVTRGSPPKACPGECMRQRQRRKFRAEKAREYADPEKRKKILDRNKRRRLENPEWAREQDRRKWERQLAKEDLDPAERDRRREYNRAKYHQDAKAIQTRRWAKLAEKLRAMTDAEISEYFERDRQYQRDHRRRERQHPERAAHRKQQAAEYRRRQREAKAAGDVSRIAQMLAGRENASKVKPCLVCGKPVVGKPASAKVCSPACQIARRNSLLFPPRPRPCIVCGTVFDSRTSAKVCSEECSQARRAGVPLDQLPKVQRLAETSTCETCGKAYRPWRPRQRGCSPDCMRAGNIRRRVDKLRKRYAPRGCLICGQEYAPSKRNQILCAAPECAAEYKRQYNRHGPFPPKSCIVCGTEFVPEMQKIVACSKACKKIRHRELQKISEGKKDGR